MGCKRTCAEGREVRPGARGMQTPSGRQPSTVYGVKNESGTAADVASHALGRGRRFFAYH
jgi:hypothetical protein